MEQAIPQYRQITQQLATGGQPDESQLRKLRGLGYQLVINLGLPDAEYALPNEAQLVESLGMEYISIPVPFASPQWRDYLAFAACFKENRNKKIFLHCAANKRVSVFLAIYQIREENLLFNEALNEIRQIWQPDEVWLKFLLKGKDQK